MNDKKILIITNMYPNKANRSFGIFVKNQVNALLKRNLQVDVLANTNQKTGKLNVLKKYFFWFFKTFLNLITKGRNYDIIHCHYVFPSGYLGALFKRFFKTRLIVTAHGGDIDKMAKINKTLFKMTKNILNQADHIIAVGEDLRNQIITNFSVDPQQVSVMSMGVNRQIFKPMDIEAIREQYGIESHVKIVLFVGNLLEQKGLMELMEAMVVLKSDPNIQLFLIGAEKDLSFKKKLEEKMSAENLEQKVSFLGVKDQHEIASWMCAADCLVLPSHIEGFGLVALEAMACGTPVIGTNVGGLKYLLSNDAGVITPVKNSKELANSILNVLSSEEKRKILIKNGYNKAEENDQERILDRLMEVYFPLEGRNYER